MATLNDQVVLFGGGNGADLGDTWVWDGSTWTELTIAGPAARGGTAATAWNGNIVLFGGEAGGVYQSDTWTFDGSAWTAQTATGPLARANASMGVAP